MPENISPLETNSALEALFNRNHIWRGASYYTTRQAVVSTGYPELNEALVNGGWPKSTLIEICQKGLQQQEWLLLLPMIKALKGYTVLLNPPATPFCQALIQAGIDLERVLIVKASNKADFVMSFCELARTQACDLLLAWQQHQQLSYTELRKCLLATNENAGVCILFRHESTQQHSSPAALRLHNRVTAHHIQLNLFKQKGVLQQSIHNIKLPLPQLMKALPAYSYLDQTNTPEKHESNRKSATITSLRKHKK